MSQSYPLDACKELKEAYDKCFNFWFAEKYLKGQHDDTMCTPLKKVYTHCVQKAMKDHNIHVNEIEQDDFEVEKKKLKAETDKKKK